MSSDVVLDSFWILGVFTVNEERGDDACFFPRGPKERVEVWGIVFPVIKPFLCNFEFIFPVSLSENIAQLELDLLA